MKKFVVLILGILSILPSVIAQKQRAMEMHNRITEMKLVEIQKNLHLDEQTLKNFRPIFLAYEKEMAATRLNRGVNLMKITKDSLSNDEADRLINNEFMNVRLMTDIRQKYYYEFKKVISPNQIIRMYQSEADIQRKMMQEYKKRMHKRTNAQSEIVE